MIHLNRKSTWSESDPLLYTILPPYSILHRKASTRFLDRLPTLCFQPRPQRRCLGVFQPFPPTVPLREALNKRQDPAVRVVGSPCRVISRPPGQEKTGVCWAVWTAEKTLASERSGNVNKYLLVVQRLNSSCMDGVSLPLSPEETRLYVQICKRVTKLLFHSC